ncbi:MAG: DUF1295 domain-containing protein [Pseudomonadota bacterium]
MDVALTITLIITCLCFTGIWLINVMIRDAGVIDYYWGPGFAIIAAVHFVIHGSGSIFEWVLLGAVSIWAARLALYLIGRHRYSETEDGRYLEMRESGGPNFWWISFFTVFLLQAFLLWMIAAPLHVAFGALATVNTGLFIAGMMIFVTGFLFEWIADYQLEKGKRGVGHSETGSALFTGGLWGKSRHPNYFGELTVWWGLSTAAFAMSGAWIAFVGPILLTVIMRFVSIPLTEQHMLRTRLSYGNYIKAVPMLIPFGRKRQMDAGNQAAE